MKLPRGGGEAAYDVIALGNVWPALSLVFALLAIYSRKWIAILPWQLQGYTLWPPAAVLVVPVLSALGASSAVLAMRRDGSTLLGRLGLWINLVIFALGTLVVVAAWLYRRVG